MTSLAQRLTLSFLGFVMAGSLALVLWLHAEQRRESRDLFTAIARANADFIRTQRLPATERTAQGLSEVLGVRVSFYRPNEEPHWIPGDEPSAPEERALAEARPIQLGFTVIEQDWEVSAAEVTPEAWLVLLRQAEPLRALRWKTLPALAAFWIFSLALAWVVARSIVQPLRKLAERLPRIAGEGGAETLPEAARADEIGQLARSYTETHTQLIAEREARAQAERLATLGRMTTGLAHEINNPLAALKLHAQLLRGEVDAEHQERVGIVLAECARIESLVSQWMYLARPHPPKTSPCDVKEIVDAVLRAQAPMAEHSGVRLESDVAEGIGVTGDRLRLTQAVANAVTNAIQAMAGSGGLLRVDARREGDKLHLEFRDGGPGFSPAALRQATDLFFSEKEGGMGIGLNVTSEILRAHGGELRFANLPGGGAVVTFVLPADAAPSDPGLRP